VTHEAVQHAVSKNDCTIKPDLKRFLGAWLKATTVERDAGQLSLVSHAKQVADFILQAVGTSRPQAEDAITAGSRLIVS
jgi:hypothetical protein